MRMALTGIIDALLARPLLVGLWMHESLGGGGHLLLPETGVPVAH
jgi:hypothetical protein